MSEIWKKIEGFEDYEVSNLGRVKSIKKGKERILKPAINIKGYLRVNLCENGKKKEMKIHQLVAIAFLGHTPNGMKTVINHINFVRTDNRLENLEITTTRENSNKKHLKSSSKFTGASWNNQAEKWQSHIYINGKLINLGYFSDELEAGKMYEIALANIDLYNGNNKQFREDLKQML